MDGEIRPATVKERLDDGDLLVVDIRPPKAFDSGHIPGSTNLPFQRLAVEVERVAGHDHVVTVCPHGKASVQAARLIASYEGFDGTVESMAGGLTEWEWELDRADSTGDPDEGPTAGAGSGSDAPF
ncbi:rhodanese-like domain-containing protein [Haloarchaeobius sp. HRN-SO-5]|uniref:rhodanese-like domain-containing protein n=1 Tax=Haloarchaeobius sp. HRN-SO-5 TaxID=3446118 RepID=UPI003EBC2AB4